MFFRYTKKKDKERHRQEYVTRDQLEPTERPEVIAESIRATVAKLATPEKKEETTKPASPASIAAPTPTPARRTPPQSYPAKATPQKKQKTGNVQAGLVLAETAEANASGNDNPKKYAQEAEKAMKVAICSLTTVSQQASEVQTNIDKFDEWAWIKGTKFYPPLIDAIKKVNEYKDQTPLITHLLLKDCDFGSPHHSSRSN